jgi:hypothetical protein
MMSALTEKKKEVVGKWVDLVLNTYESPEFFKTQKDRIANPVGSNIAEGLREIFELLLAGADSEGFSEPLDRVIRIRAVQDFSPSQAVSFMFVLKDVVRWELAKNGGILPAELAEFESAIDRVALQAFDIYMACRERLFQIRIRELQNGTHILTDGTKCASAWLKNKLNKSADNNQLKQSNLK